MDKDEIAFIDELKPVLSEEKPLATLASLYVVSLFSFAVLGGGLGFNLAYDITAAPDPFRSLLILGSIFLLSGSLSALSILAFLKRFKALVRSLDSKKESQKEKRPIHQ